MILLINSLYLYFTSFNWPSCSSCQLIVPIVSLLCPVAGAGGDEYLSLFNDQIPR